MVRTFRICNVFLPSVSRHQAVAMKLAPLVFLPLALGASSWLDTMVGKTTQEFDYEGYCHSMKHGYQRYWYSWVYASQTMDFHITCSGKEYTVKCSGWPKFEGCTGPAGPAPAPPTALPPLPPEYQQTTATGCPGMTGGIRRKQAQEVLTTHNKFRCVAGVPALKWSASLACQAQNEENRIHAWKHSDSFNLPIMAAENLAQGTNVEDAVYMWFVEFLTPHYQAHLTAMLWNDTKKLGCGFGKADKQLRCMYADIASNWGGPADYKKQVPKLDLEGLTQAHVKEKFAKCAIDIEDVKRLARKFEAWGIHHSLDPAISSRIGLSEEGDLDFLQEERLQVAGSLVASGALLAVAATMAIVVVKLRWSLLRCTQEFLILACFPPLLLVVNLSWYSQIHQ
eukprot:TRINITY_DN20487_c0_g1_i2.p1 TRINITY_DN20487_c0_g1~~TRINITY_DN20487_c0_g1_i2.p1  ORF type:complete len:396 (-),score=50.54 TRINITY_DN20487_c0_g1_i2:958-2145(-)